MGSLYFLAVSFPQKQAESERIKSGWNVLTSSASIESIIFVVWKELIVIWVIETLFSFFSCFSVSSGR